MRFSYHSVVGGDSDIDGDLTRIMGYFGWHAVGVIGGSSGSPGLMGSVSFRHLLSTPKGTSCPQTFRSIQYGGSGITPAIVRRFAHIRVFCSTR
jgi:hypothetical protein